MAEIAGQSEADVPFAPGEILVISGLQFQLQWESLANLDLEVRDPVGGSVYFSRPVTESGGLFGVNVTASARRAAARCRPNRPTGLPAAFPLAVYEILVYNQPLGDCPTSSAADFRIDLRLDDRSAAPLVGSIAPGQTWVGSVTVDAAGMLRPGANGSPLTRPCRRRTLRSSCSRQCRWRATKRRPGC